MSQGINTGTSVSADQIERIVREVLASLSVANSTQAAMTQDRVVEIPQATLTVTNSVHSNSVHSNSGHSNVLHLSVPVLSLDTLRTLAKDTKEIAVLPTTLVTPAAKDFLKEKGIAWNRASSPKVAAQPSPAGVASSEKKTEVLPTKRLFVTGSVLWLRNLEKQLCPKANLVDQVQIDDAAAIRAVAQAIRNQASSAIAIVKAPHSALWQAARDEALRPAIISQWSDLAEVFREVPTNMLIVPANRWNIAGSANIARKFQEHIQANR